MKYQHIKKTTYRPFFTGRGNHHCPDCNSVLEEVEVSKIVNSASPESKYYNFHTVDNFMVGNVKFIWNEFACPSCGNHYIVDYIWQYEKEKKYKDKEEKKRKARADRVEKRKKRKQQRIEDKAGRAR